MISPNGIQAILFDLDGTLRHNVPSSNHTFFDIAVQLGVPDSHDKRMRTMRWVHYYWAQSPELMGDLDTYGMLTDEFWTYYSYRTLVEFECTPRTANTLAPEVQRRMAAEYQPQDWVPQDVHTTLEKLRGVGFTLAVVSNRSKSYDEQLAALGLQAYFSFAVAAGEINAWKPEAGIFLYALDRLGTRPEQTLYIGDNYYADVIGAQNAGLHPILMDPEGIFPDAACPVIRSIGELIDLLGYGSEMQLPDAI